MSQHSFHQSQSNQPQTIEEVSSLLQQNGFSEITSDSSTRYLLSDTLQVFVLLHDKGSNRTPLCSLIWNQPNRSVIHKESNTALKSCLLSESTDMSALHAHLEHGDLLMQNPFLRLSDPNPIVMEHVPLRVIQAAQSDDTIRNALQGRVSDNLFSRSDTMSLLQDRSPIGFGLVTQTIELFEVCSPIELNLESMRMRVLSSGVTQIMMQHKSEEKFPTSYSFDSASNEWSSVGLYGDTSYVSWPKVKALFDNTIDISLIDGKPSFTIQGEPVSVDEVGKLFLEKQKEALLDVQTASQAVTAGTIESIWNVRQVLLWEDIDPFLAAVAADLIKEEQSKGGFAKRMFNKFAPTVGKIFSDACVGFADRLKDHPVLDHYNHAETPRLPYPLDSVTLTGSTEAPYIGVWSIHSGGNLPEVILQQTQYLKPFRDHARLQGVIRLAESEDHIAYDLRAAHEAGFAWDYEKSTEWKLVFNYNFNNCNYEVMIYTEPQERGVILTNGLLVLPQSRNPDNPKNNIEQSVTIDLKKGFVDAKAFESDVKTIMANFYESIFSK
jgi:hypothetical protein